MKLITQTDIFGERFGEEKAIQLLSAAGFDALDYSMFAMQKDDHPLNQPDFAAYVQKIKAVAGSCKIPFLQAHAPFPSYLEGKPEYNEAIFQKIVRSMEVAGMLGAKIIVVHPPCVDNCENLKDLCVNFYRKLTPYCEKFGVKVALENMWGYNKETEKIYPFTCGTGEEFAAFLDELDARYFTACLDLGHCGLVGETADGMIRALGHDRLKALHVHDNDHFHDTHTAPYFGKMDWDAITKALADIDFTGEFTFESDYFFNSFPDALLPDAAKFLHSIGRTLIQKIEQAK